VNNLQVLNRESTSYDINLSKNDSDQEDSIKINNARVIQNENKFNKHTSNFCTSYVDFDYFSYGTLSNLV
jgi:hypothetical protein